PLGGAVPLAEPAPDSLPDRPDLAQDRADLMAEEAPFIEAEEDDSDLGQIIAFPGEAEANGQASAFAASETLGEESPVPAASDESDLAEDFDDQPQDGADMPP